MKIKSDFVTNSSSSSFIFGNDLCGESINTIYNFIRIICSEILYLYNILKRDNVIREKFENMLFQDRRLQNLLNNKYVKNSFFSILQNKYMYKYFINLACKNKDDLDEMRTILDYLNYNDYIQFSENGLMMYDVREDDISKECFDTFVYNYYLRLDMEYDEIESLLESLPNNNDYYKNFVINNIGHIYIRYEEFMFCALFDATLKYFCNYWDGVFSFFEKD